MSEFKERLDIANQAVAIIGGHGRQFFYSVVNQRLGALSLCNDLGAPSLNGLPDVVYIDPDTGQRTVISEYTDWTPFIALPARKVLLSLAHYIQTGRKIPADQIAPPYHTLKGNHWQYDEDSAHKVRSQLVALAAFGPVSA